MAIESKTDRPRIDVSESHASAIKRARESGSISPSQILRKMGSSGSNARASTLSALRLGKSADKPQTKGDILDEVFSGRRFGLWQNGTFGSTIKLPAAVGVRTGSPVSPENEKNQSNVDDYICVCGIKNFVSHSTGNTAFLNSRGKGIPNDRWDIPGNGLVVDPAIQHTSRSFKVDAEFCSANELAVKPSVKALAFVVYRGSLFISLIQS